jgi:hypothetical protein
VAEFASVRHGLIGFNVRIAPDNVCGCMDAAAQNFAMPLARAGYDRSMVRYRYIVAG